mmetsp:Transcript_11481/g.17307  ORF Transcript_11481/g.17307 Transcript_11481/m.17307 type:complete len:183 (-) Transcript_11481:52-600(-)
MGMLGLAYGPLALWLPLLTVQCLAATFGGRGMQGMVKSVTGLLVDTPAAPILKIIWVAMLFLCLDCLRNTFAAPTPGGDPSSYHAAFELYAAREGVLAWGMNLVSMLAISAVHKLNAEAIKLERDRDMMKRQAEQQGQFAKQLLSEKSAEKGVAKETPMPAKEGESKEASSEDKPELRKRAD